MKSIKLPPLEVVPFGDVRQLQLDPKAPQYFRPYDPRYPTVDSFASDGKLYNATLAQKHTIATTIVRTLQIMPEQFTPELYWVVGTKDALLSFPAGIKPFANKLTAATMAENCPPDEPSEEFWTAPELKWEQVPRKARHLLAKLQQYVMWLDYREFAYANPVGAASPEPDPPSSQVQRSGALPAARSLARGSCKLPLSVCHFASRPTSWCRSVRRPAMRATQYSSMIITSRNTLLPKTSL